jgi:hypothetical protein
VTSEVQVNLVIDEVQNFQLNGMATTHTSWLLLLCWC